jgi:oligopeptide/dipeptide ABC transporter ATP-binding protein
VTDPPVLEVRGLVKRFPIRGGWLDRHHTFVKAVDGVDFQVRRGETFGLVGESGCGKTTVATLLLKLIEPSAGEIRFDGRNTTGLSAAAIKQFRRQVQIVFQDPYGSLDPRQTMLSALTEPLFALGIATSRAQATQHARKAFGLVGLDPELLRRLPHELSGGQRQRVVIARALAVGPRLVILDEPTSSVDVSVQAQILTLLEDLKQRQGLTYLLISHNLAVVRHMSDTVAVMYLGRIVESAESAALFAAPLHPYTAALISAIPVPDPEAPKIAALAQGDVSSPVNTPSGCRYHPRCPFAQDICRGEDPPLRKLQPGHSVACHFPGVASGR